MVRLTLDRMAAGGIYDHLGGGFASLFGRRPLAGAAFREDALRQRAAGRARISMRIWSRAMTNYARVVRETLDYVLRDMTDPAGGFYSTEDADSEGEEGLVLRLDARRNRGGARRRARRDVRPRVRRERRRQLRRPQHSQFAEDARAMCDDSESRAATTSPLNWPRVDSKLFAVREKRVRPGRDDKVIVAWNGLMIDAMARAGAAPE